MVRLNRPLVHEPVKTHEGGRAERQKPLVELTRAVSTCLLFENTFYEKGEDIAKRIADLCEKVPAESVAALAVRARTDLKLRHVPLFLVRQMARLHRGSSIVSQTLEQVIQRPDEMGEFLAMYWKDSPRGKTAKLSAQVKKGLARVFGKFDEYQLAKWDKDSAIKLRDVAFLCHPKAGSAERGALYAKLVNKSYFPEKTKSGFPVKFTYQLGEFEGLQTPDTWEVILSGAKQSGLSKKEAWEKVIDIWITE